MKINDLTNLRKVFFLVSLFALPACEKPIRVEDVGDKFYLAQKEKDFQKALALCSPQAFEENIQSKWLELFKNKYEQAGELIDYQRVSAETSNEDGITVTALNYQVKYKEMILYERIVFIKEKSAFKIVGYKFDPEKPKD